MLEETNYQFVWPNGSTVTLNKPFQAAASSLALFVWKSHWRKNASEYLEGGTSPQLQQPSIH